MKQWLSLATQRSVVQRSLRVSLVVGTALMLINQGDIIVTGQYSFVLAVKAILTYLVPYCVATYVAVSALR